MRRNLVIVRAGDASLHPSWLSPERSWDLIVNYYGDNPDIYRGEGMCRIDSKGPKWPALHALMQGLFSELGAYDYIWFPDDDLACEPEAIERMFRICRDFHLDLAQPALTADSHIGVSITVANQSFLLRHTNFVEIMAPCFSRAFLQRCWPTFKASLSGWGLDFVWPRMAEHPQKVAIIDAVQIVHTRPHGGPNYEMLKQRGVDPEQELADLLKREQIELRHIIKGGIDRDGKLLAIWNGEHRELIHKLITGYLPQFGQLPDILFSLIEPVLSDLAGKTTA